MSTHNTILLSGLVFSITLGLAQAQQTRTVAERPAKVGESEELMPQSPSETSGKDGTFGTVPTAEEIATIDIDVMPGGSGLPQGHGTHAEGAQIYKAKCAVCHGAALEGVAELGAPRLIGGRGTLATDKPVKTVESYWPEASTLFDYVNRAMPLTTPGTLTPDEVYSLSAFILGEAGITDVSATLDKDSFADVVMPNAEGFYPDPRPDTP